MEAMKIPPGITSSHKALLFNIPLDHTSTVTAVRPCLELARTCVVDLEDLIKLCNENLPLLRTKPAIFQRTINIIESARGKIARVCQLLERLTTSGRPESSGSFAEARGHHDHDGGGQIQISFRNRWGWLIADARHLVNHEQPLLAKEHGAVVSELNFIRHLLLIAPTIVKGPGPGLAQQDGQSNSNNHGGSGRRSESTAWENVGLLGEIMGGGGSGKCNRTTEQRQPQQQTYPDPRSGSGGNYLVLPPPYSGTPGSKATNASSTTLWDMRTGFQELPASASQTVSANAHTRPNALHKSLSSTMVFDTVGVGLLYGDGLGHTKSSSLTSTSTPRSELPGPLAAATSNTLIYNQHTHHYDYQCYHHRHNHNQMAINEGEPQELSGVAFAPDPVELP